MGKPEDEDVETDIATQLEVSVCLCAQRWLWRKGREGKGREGKRREPNSNILWWGWPSSQMYAINVQALKSSVPKFKKLSSELVKSIKAVTGA